MKKIIAYIAMSLDGYIATSEDGVDWLGGDGSDPTNLGSYPAFIETIDTVILGHATYHQIVTVLSPTQWPYENMHSYVLTHRALENTQGITFTHEPLETLLPKLKEEAGKHIWICGGGSIIRQLHDLGLIDEYHLSVIPTILGKGIRLFGESNAPRPLKLKHTQSYNGIVDLVYEVR